MTLETLREFLLWSMIINVALLLLSFLFLACAHNFVYRVHGKFFKLSEEHFSTTIYGIMGLYKILILFFNVIPYVTLYIIG
jgi:hypothetical protein